MEALSRAAAVYSKNHSYAGSTTTAAAEDWTGAEVSAATWDVLLTR